MNQVDAIGFLDTIGYSTTVNPVAEPDQLVLKFARINENQKIIDASSNDVSRFTNLLRDAWVYLSPDDILSYTTDGTTTTMLLKPAAIAVEPGKNTDIYNLFAIEGSVGEKIVGQQAAVELITSANNVILPKDPAAANRITQSGQVPVNPTPVNPTPVNPTPRNLTTNTRDRNIQRAVTANPGTRNLDVPLDSVMGDWTQYWNTY